MINRRLTGAFLVGKKCRPVHTIRNGGGACVTPATLCTIVNVVPGHGFTIQTEKCPHCGQYAYIARVGRDELELEDEYNGKNTDE